MDENKSSTSLFLLKRLALQIRDDDDDKNSSLFEFSEEFRRFKKVHDLPDIVVTSNNNENLESDHEDIREQITKMKQIHEQLNSLEELCKVGVLITPELKKVLKEKTDLIITLCEDINTMNLHKQPSPKWSVPRSPSKKTVRQFLSQNYNKQKSGEGESDADDEDSANSADSATMRKVPNTDFTQLFTPDRHEETKKRQSLPVTKIKKNPSPKKSYSQKVMTVADSSINSTSSSESRSNDGSNNDIEDSGSPRPPFNPSLIVTGSGSSAVMIMTPGDHKKVKRRSQKVKKSVDKGQNSSDSSPRSRYTRARSEKRLPKLVKEVDKRLPQSLVSLFAQTNAPKSKKAERINITTKTGKYPEIIESLSQKVSSFMQVLESLSAHFRGHVASDHLHHHFERGKHFFSQTYDQLDELQQCFSQIFTIYIPSSFRQQYTHTATTPPLPLSSSQKAKSKIRRDGENDSNKDNNNGNNNNSDKERTKSFDDEEPPVFDSLWKSTCNESSLTKEKIKEICSAKVDSKIVQDTQFLLLALTSLVKSFTSHTEKISHSFGTLSTFLLESAPKDAYETAWLLLLARTFLQVINAAVIDVELFHELLVYESQASSTVTSSSSSSSFSSSPSHPVSSNMRSISSKGNPVVLANSLPTKSKSSPNPVLKAMASSVPSNSPSSSSVLSLSPSLSSSVLPSSSSLPSSLPSLPSESQCFLVALWQDEEANVDCFSPETLDTLVHRITSPSISALFVDTFLHFYTLFCSPRDFFRRLVGRLSVPKGITVDDERAMMIQLQTINVIIEWIKRDLNLCDHVLRQEIRKFCIMTLQSTAPTQAAKLLNILDAQDEIPPTFGTSSLPIYNLHSPGITYGQLMFRFEAMDIAAQLTLLDMILFLKIDASEFIGQRWSKPKLKILARNLENSSQRTDCVSFWAASLVVTQKNLEYRIAMLEKLIDVARCLMDLRNISSLFGIVCGLNFVAVDRLKKTWAGISKKKADFLKTASLLADPTSGNLFNLRQVMELIGKNSIPHLSLYTHDYTTADEGSTAIIDGEEKRGEKIINFTKYKILSKFMFSLERHQKSILLEENFTDLYELKKEPLFSLLYQLPYLNQNELSAISADIEPKR